MRGLNNERNKPWKFEGTCHFCLYQLILSSPQKTHFTQRQKAPSFFSINRPTSVTSPPTTTYNVSLLGKERIAYNHPTIHVAHPKRASNCASVRNGFQERKSADTLVVTAADLDSGERKGGSTVLDYIAHILTLHLRPRILKNDVFAVKIDHYFLGDTD